MQTPYDLAKALIEASAKVKGWTHVICRTCWDVRQPGRTPVRVIEAEPRVCCFCGIPTKAGIYVWEDPEVLKCIHFESEE
jgi:hypothetical protein